MHSKEIKLTGQPPFDFELCGLIFSNGDPEIRRYEDGKFWQLLKVENSLIHLLIESSGNREQPELKVSIKSEEELNSGFLKSVAGMAARIFNLDLDINPFYQQIKEDKVMKNIAGQLIGLKSPLTPTIYESLVDSIIEQQISLKAAHTLQNRLIKMIGDSMEVNGRIYYSYPTPQDLAPLDLQIFRDCGLSFRKAEYIRDLSRDILNQEIFLEEMKEMKNTSELIDELCQIRGVGTWTAELTVLRSLGRFDAIPGDDIALRRIISHFYRDDKKISADEAREIASKWGDWKGLAGYYLEVAEMLKITL